MREILFKAKRKDNGDWVIGSYICHEDIFDNNIKYHYIENYRGDDRDEIIPQTVCQYTGLKDKNGKMIFEGDVVEADLTHNRPFKEFTDFIKYSEYTCSFEFNRWDYFHSGNSHGFKVIGNIHDEVK